MSLYSGKGTICASKWIDPQKSAQHPIKRTGLLKKSHIHYSTEQAIFLVFFAFFA